MYVVSIALDPKCLDPESVVAFRSRAYGTLVEHYSIVVPSPATVTVRLTDRVTAYGVGGRNKGTQFFKMYRFVSSLIRAKKCDVITAQDMYFLGFLGLLFARRYHLGLEVQVLGIEKLTPFRKRLAVFVLKRASVIRALSSRLKGRLISEFGIPEEKINVVPIYVDVNKLGLNMRTLSDEDTEKFRILREKFRETYGTSVNFLTVSRLVPIKRIESQLQAVKDLLPTFPNIMLHIVGSGPDEKVLREKVANLSLTAHVIFHGYQSGYMLGMFYIECDCFLLTSDYEGWGMVIVEAITAGLPVIMTDVGCAGELIIDEESGLIVPVGDLEALKGAMQRIMQDSKLKNELAEGALHALRELPSFEVILEQYKKNWEVALECPL
jgi:glycosyltransferase involved in cell wall biosynthesis